MKKYLLVLLLAGNVSIAQNKLDLPARDVMERYHARIHETGDMSKSAKGMVTGLCA